MEQQKLPYANLILIFGIISIITCCCYGIVGLVFGITAWILAHRALKLHAEHSDQYEGVQTVKTGKILAIVGVVLNVIYLAIFLWFVSYFGWETLQNPDRMREIMEGI